MTPEELSRREERARTETFVIVRTEDGFRVHVPGGNAYYVTGSPEEPSCSCPDFEHHEGDPAWRCKHILAVLARNGGPKESQETVPSATAPELAIPRMILKRSVSPDGKIDALSVEFSLPVNGSTSEAIETRAREVLGLQDAIAKGFLTRNGRPQRTNGRPAPKPVTGEPIDATILSIGGMDGKWGRRLFLTIEAQGRNLRVYGSRNQLAARLNDAGYSEMASELAEGLSLQLPCRVVTLPSTDGKYVNVARVLPPATVPSGTTW